MGLTQPQSYAFRSGDMAARERKDRGKERIGWGLSGIAYMSLFTQRKHRLESRRGSILSKCV